MYDIPNLGSWSIFLIESLRFIKEHAKGRILEHAHLTRSLRKA